MIDPLFSSGDRVWISKVSKTKTVLHSYVYKGAEYTYVLVDENGVEDEGWREDELSIPPDDQP